MPFSIYYSPCFAVCWHYKQILCSHPFPPPATNTLYLWSFLPILIFFMKYTRPTLVILSFHSSISNAGFIFYTAVYHCDSFIDTFCLTFTRLCVLSQPRSLRSLYQGSTTYLRAKAKAMECLLRRYTGQAGGRCLSRQNLEVCSAFRCCAGGLSAQRRHMFSLAAPLSASVWAAVKRRCTHVENPGSRRCGLCYSSCPQWGSNDVYSVCFSVEFCLSAAHTQHGLFFSVVRFWVLYIRSIFCRSVCLLDVNTDVRQFSALKTFAIKSLLCSNSG